jgi:hypothetical protein
MCTCHLYCPLWVKLGIRDLKIVHWSVVHFMKISDISHQGCNINYQSGLLTVCVFKNITLLWLFLSEMIIPGILWVRTKFCMIDVVK